GGDATEVEQRVDVFIGEILFLTGGGSGPSACDAAKFKLAGKIAFGKLKCHAKAVTKDEAVDQGCLDKQSEKLVAGTAKAEAKPDCTVTGVPLDSSIDDLVADAVAQITSP